MNVARPPRQPYPGLRPFRREDTDLFFGREHCVDQMVDLLAKEHFLAVLGSSGSGKSSLVKTGLLDGLAFGLMAQAGSRWRVAEFRPSDGPLRNLARALLQRGTLESRSQDVNALRTFLTRGPRSIIEWCNDGQLAPRENLLLLVDQFEELFRYSDYVEREEAEAFVALLLESSKPGAALPIYVVLTMRSEFLGACALIEGLAQRMNAAQFLTPRMTREQCRAAIEGPAEVCEISIEPALVNRLLNELENFAPWEAGDRGTLNQLDRLARRADQLPLLQHALNHMWENAIRPAEPPADGKARILRLADFETMGGLQGALNYHADDVLSKLGKERRPLAEAVFRALTAGTSAADAVRRPTQFKELVAICGGDEDSMRATVENDIRDVINAFRGRGRNFLLPESDITIMPETRIDISHESVIRQWHQLSEWLETEARDVQQWRRLADAAELERKGEGGLLHGPTLQHLYDWQHKAKPTRAWARRYGGGYDVALEFLDKSQEAERREVERRRIEANQAAERERLREREAAARRLASRTRYAAVALAGLAAIAAAFAYRSQTEAIRATVSYEAARGTVGGLVDQLVAGMRSVEGVPLKTINATLTSVQSLLDALQKANSDDPQLKDIRSSMFFEFAKLYQNSKNPEEALNSATQALSLRRQLVDSGDRRSTSPWNLAMSLDQVGDIERRAHPELARAHYDEALKSRTLNASTTSSEQFACGMSFSNIRLGDLEADVGHYGSASQRYDAAFQQIAAVAWREPREKMPDCVWQEFSWDYDKRGQFNFRLKNFAQALSDFQNALCIRRDIAKSKPTDLDLKRDIAFSLERSARAYAAEQDWRAADDAFLEVLKIRREVAMSDPGRILWQQEYSKSLNGFADMLKARRPDVALALVDSALEIRKRLVDRLPNDEGAKSELIASETASNEISEQLDPVKAIEIKSDPDRIIGSEERAFSDRQLLAHGDDADCFRAISKDLKPSITQK